ncbi:LysR family transcriptional regulator [Amylibacter marinus]|uniref:LysR family transcriptional regulator n=1 Tax=Amylibacter marinus TaxID=1475483 RepID=A0ABQ5VX12_9RHOB|nr:LysR family transcriptional regulator [Amylibacter marinus]GLQ35823.1 LysR family transcriptional regulator [Amylibacter marinus]
MDHWTEIRTAAQVARLGTVSAAAQVLGIHRATVTRHIDLLEASFAAPLFLRHARGFTPTDLGASLLRSAEETDARFAQLARQAQRQSQTLSGEFTITSLNTMAPYLLPAIHEFTTQHPEVRVHFITGDKIVKLELGEADVALRVGRQPDDPDNVVRAFGGIQLGLFAAQKYIDAHGLPPSEHSFAHHHFVGGAQPDPRPPFLRWLHECVPASALRFRSQDNALRAAAVSAGLGIGFLPRRDAIHDPDLTEVMPPRPEWQTPIWLVTHVDLHRTPKVQAFLKILHRVVDFSGTE